jgi:hypothetical protein
MFNNHNDNGFDVTVAVLAKGNCATYCQQETNAMFFVSRFSPLISPWSIVLLEKLTGFRLVKKFPEFYRTLPEG